MQQKSLQATNKNEKKKKLPSKALCPQACQGFLELCTEVSSFQIALTNSNNQTCLIHKDYILFHYEESMDWIELPEHED